MAAERRASLTHAQSRRSLVEDLVSRPQATPVTPTVVTPSPSAGELAPSRASEGESRQGGTTSAASPRPGDAAVDTAGDQARYQPRRGPGRPRNDRIMRPFTTTIEIGLRARIDAYCNEHNATRVDVLDQALREALDSWEGRDQVRALEPDAF